MFIWQKYGILIFPKSSIFALTNISTMFASIFEKFQRKKQLSILTNHPNTKVERIKIGIHNQFVLYPDVQKIFFGKNLNFRNFIHIIVGKNAILEIGDHVFLNNFCSINCLEHISIGENTLFGENVKLYDHNHEYTRNNETLRVEHAKFKTSPIKIGKNCWLGSNVTVLKGVTIGENCIIGAGCTIAKDVPANSTVINQQNLIVK